MTGMSTVQRKVIGVDTYLWSEPIPGEAKARQRRSAERGDVIEISEDEAARGESIVDRGIPALGPADADVANGEGFAPASDDDLAAMSVAEITAYLGTVPEDLHDDEVDRVISAENGRTKPRTGVLALGPDFEPDPDDDLNA